LLYEQVAATMRTDCTFRLGWLPIEVVLDVPAVPAVEDEPVEDEPGWSVEGLVEPVVPVLLLDPDFIELSTVPETSTLCPT
jgi:hypothetical protein